MSRVVIGYREADLLKITIGKRLSRFRTFFFREHTIRPFNLQSKKKNFLPRNLTAEFAMIFVAVTIIADAGQR
jgi:hypothetical protein